MQSALHQTFSKIGEKRWKSCALKEVAPIQSNNAQNLEVDRFYNYVSLKYTESYTADNRENRDNNSSILEGSV